MSAAVVARPHREARRPRQDPLFDELRRALPGPERGPGSDPGPAPPGPATARGEREPRSGGGRLTLEDRLERIWEDLLAAGAAECPVCAGVVERGEGWAACRACGSALG